MYTNAQYICPNNSRLDYEYAYENENAYYTSLTNLVHLVDQVNRGLAEGVQFFGHACYLLELGQGVAYYPDSLYMYIHMDICT